MGLQLIVIGESEKGYVSIGENVFAKRLQRFIKLQKIVITPQKKWNQLPAEQKKEVEGRKILDSIKTNDYLILLDERGKDFSSKKFAQKMEQILSIGSGNICFVIGGAYGFSDEVYQRANEKISLSKMTFNHQLIRVIFMEQLYRAFTIIHGHPYHND